MIEVPEWTEEHDYHGYHNPHNYEKPKYYYKPCYGYPKGEYGYYDGAHDQSGGYGGYGEHTPRHYYGDRHYYEYPDKQCKIKVPM